MYAHACACNCSPNLRSDSHLFTLHIHPRSPLCIGTARRHATEEVRNRCSSVLIRAVLERHACHSGSGHDVSERVPSACEASVHAMTSMFAGPNTEGVLLVDASNAFNSLNRQAALHNVPHIFPALGKVFVNTYSSPIRLFVAGGGKILSQEGTCQGDPLAMVVYVVATVPLVKHLAAACPSVVQSWYADDDAAADRLLQLPQYWDTVEQAGRGYGYHANAAKTILVTKPEHLDRAREVFDGTGVTISAEGARYLGGVLGLARYTEECISVCWDWPGIRKNVYPQSRAAGHRNPSLWLDWRGTSHTRHTWC